MQKLFKSLVLRYLVVLLLVNSSRANEVTVGQSCARPGSKHVNTDNCRTYIVCNSGVYELEYCPSGFYNPLKNDCDLDYKCTLDNLPEGTTRFEGSTTSVLLDEGTSTTMETTTDEVSSTQSESTTIMTSSSERVSTTSSPTEATTTVSLTTTTTGGPSTTTAVGDPYSCPSVDSAEPTYLNDKQNCEKYYLCYHSRPVEMQCISGMYWNVETRRCDYAQNVKCPGDGNVDANPLPRCNSPGSYTMPHPSNCHNFLMCIDGAQTVQQCSDFNYWDVIGQKCVIKDQATCILDISSVERYGSWT